MSNLTFLVAMGLVACAAAAFVKPTSPDLDSRWLEWKIAHTKSYTNDMNELERRLVWEENVKMINMHNLDHSLHKKGFRLGMNEYGDMRLHEVRSTMNGYKSSNVTKVQGSTFLTPSNIQVPDTVDWRTKGYVTPVKNQGQCGSCWAFSTTGSLEGQTFKKTSKLVSLSEQNLVDCSRTEGNMGCEGGLMDQGFQYVIDNHGIDSEDCYPYDAEDETCHYKASCDSAEVTGFTDVTSGDEQALMEAVASVGPVSVAIDASHQSFQLYESGVYDEPECSSSELDHGVLVVGYGTDGGKDYWLVKNSWGETWGLSGYIKMSRNKSNQCGIATSASYPLV
ncbi:cathepsin L1-like [Strongylocentrotus purpuratus]|uniref:Cathepsin L n=1 Tax=Strongylocentrotus purpuratus TaxID=7668 RepID=A0A7M7PUC8_STRPU|nr:cathepsin L1-like [Strongylocentrotus purpuratus]|eukprot:XP_011676529.1 PREDICTED: cathepsin L1 isoform X2 [Strongylocentrotus purpuratus]